MIAHGRAVRVDPEIIDQDQDELAGDPEDNITESSIQVHTPIVGFCMAFYDFWCVKLKDLFILRLRKSKLALKILLFQSAVRSSMNPTTTSMARRGAWNAWVVFALLWLAALMDNATTLLSVARLDVSVAKDSLMLADLFLNTSYWQLGSSLKSTGTSELPERRWYVL
jgi:hypothetical protein